MKDMRVPFEQTKTDFFQKVLTKIYIVARALDLGAGFDSWPE